MHPKKQENAENAMYILFSAAPFFGNNYSSASIQ